MRGNEEYTWVLARATLALFVFGTLILLRRTACPAALAARCTQRNAVAA
jgi:hypothetical protein